MRKQIFVLPFLVAAVSLMTTYSAAVAADAEWEKAVEAAETALQHNDAEHIDVNLEKALAEAGDDDTARATIQNQIGIIRLAQHRYVDAQKAFAIALELREKFSGPNDIATFQTVGNLALAESKVGNEVKAEALFKRCIDGKRRVNPISPSLALSLTNLAHLYADERRCNEAKTLYSEALGIDSTEYGASHVEVAQDLFNLGALLYHCNNFAEAIPYLERAKRSYESLSDEYGKAKSLHYIALCETGRNNPAKAAEAALAALQTHEHFKGKGHNDTLVHLLNAADAVDASGDAVKAEKLYKQALSSAKASKDPSNFHLTECSLELGEYYLRHNSRDRAEQYFKQALVHYDMLNKRERRTLYELPLAYTSLLNDAKRTEEAEALSNKYVDVFVPTSTKAAVKEDAPQR
jgi:tetratricopeptide (TPR) repeat protein